MGRKGTELRQIGLLNRFRYRSLISLYGILLRSPTAWRTQLLTDRSISASVTPRYWLRERRRARVAASVPGTASNRPIARHRLVSNWRPVPGNGTARPRSHEAPARR